MIDKIRLIALDLDGTLTQHKSKLDHENKAVLQELGKRYKLLMVGAGQCMRIFNQMNQFPIDIIGNYGLQYGEYNEKTKSLDIIENITLPIDKEAIQTRIADLRKSLGLTEFVGDSVEYHPSGCFTFPILGTKASLEEKLAYDPTREKRRRIYNEVTSAFNDYMVFIGGTSSFDMTPKPYNKYYALSKYCIENKYSHSELIYIGDDYGLGGNDESVYQSDIEFICVDDYKELYQKVKHLYEVE